MNRLALACSTFALLAAIAPPASAQSSDIALRPGLTPDGFQSLISELGPMMRFRQLGDSQALGKGRVDIGVQLADAPIGDANRSWSLAFPRVSARFGVNDRVDVGAWGGINTQSNYGLAGFETRIALVTEGASWPVSVSVRPSVTVLVGPSDLWAANLSADLSVSRAFGPVTPYAGIAAMTSGAIERSDAVDLRPASTGDTLGYAGLAFRWGVLSLAAEVEKNNQVSYAFRIGTRF